MSITYSTGELANLCGVTVRTVQYYDSKGLLHPSEKTEGGNRLYNEDDAAELRFILLLKSLGLGLSQIRGVLESPNRASVAQTLLDEQRAALTDDIAEKRSQLAMLDSLQADIRLTGDISIKDRFGMASHMDNRKAFRKFMAVMVVLGLIVDALWIGTLIYSIMTGAWWTFAVGLAIAVVIISILVNAYWKRVTYICPDCHGEFKPRFKQFFFGAHTPKTRKLTCACCGTKDWCVERWHTEPVSYPAKTCIVKGDK